jgi:hypothetical protein
MKYPPNGHERRVQGSTGPTWQLKCQLRSSFSGLVELDIRIQKGVPCDGHIEKEVYLQRTKTKQEKIK